jgi:hypothetical protein|nr:MAG TPA: vesicle-associated membrane protein 2 [Caudoviricetes sp.]
MKRKMKNREWLKSLAMAFTAIIFCLILTGILVVWLAAH